MQKQKRNKNETKEIWKTGECPKCQTRRTSRELQPAICQSKMRYGLRNQPLHSEPVFLPLMMTMVLRSEHFWPPFNFTLLISIVPWYPHRDKRCRCSSLNRRQKVPQGQRLRKLKRLFSLYFNLGDRCFATHHSSEWWVTICWNMLQLGSTSLYLNSSAISFW